MVSNSPDCSLQPDKLVAKIISYEGNKPKVWPLEKPKYATITPNTKLLDLVNQDSFMFFDIFQLPWDWLKVAPQDWENFPNYQEARTFVRTCKVVNDAAECGIKLVTDYTKILTVNEEMRKKILITVDRNRKMIPDMKKKP